MLQIFFILISVKIKVLLILHIKFQPNIPSRSRENGGFNSFAIFSNGGHLEFNLDQTKFYYSKVLESDHAVYEIRDSWMQWFKRISRLNGLKC